MPVRELIALLIDIGYDGAISSEYEGWHWNYWQSPSTSFGPSRRCSARPPPTRARG